MKGLFSVIVPVYNVEKFLPRCLDSIIKQTYQYMEIILIDDGSTDRSGEICEKYAKINAKIRVIHQENKGLPAARNEGIRNAKGEFVVFVDSDDFVEKELLSKINEKMKEGYDICSFSVRRVDEEGKLLYDMLFGENPGKIDFSEVNKKEFIWGKVMQYKVGWEAWISTYRMDIIRNNNLNFHEDILFAEDIAFTVEYILCAKKWVKIPDILYNYTMRKDSIIKVTDVKSKLEGLWYYNFYYINESWKKKDSKYYTDEDTCMLYSSILYYFYSSFLQEVGLVELRNIIHSSTALMQHKLLWSEVKKYRKKLYRLYGKKETMNFICFLSFLENGNLDRYIQKIKK